MKRVVVKLGVRLPEAAGYAVIITDPDSFQVTEEGRVLARETSDGTWRDIGELTDSAREAFMREPDSGVL